MNKNIWVLLLIASTFWGANAFSKRLSPGVACRSDIKKFCRDIIRGQGRLSRCLRDNKSQLSKKCNTAISQLEDSKKAKKQACEDDLKRLCDKFSDSTRKSEKCLWRKKAELTTGCREVLTSNLGACFGERMEYCSNTRPGKGRIKKCLKENKDNLSSNCLKAVESKESLHQDDL